MQITYTHSDVATRSSPGQIRTAPLSSILCWLRHTHDQRCVCLFILEWHPQMSSWIEKPCIPNTTLTESHTKGAHTTDEQKNTKQDVMQESCWDTGSKQTISIHVDIHTSLELHNNFWKCYLNMPIQPCTSWRYIRYCKVKHMNTGNHPEISGIGSCPYSYQE